MLDFLLPMLLLPSDLSEEEYAAFVAAATEPLPPEWADPGPLTSPPPPAVLELTPLELDPEVAARVPGVVGMTGKPGSGKDTAAWTAAFELAGAGRRALVVGTSDPVVKEANAFLTYSGRRIGHANKSWGPYRRLLQTLGAVRRRGDETYWNRAHRRMLAEQRAAEIAAGNGEPVIFITGLRTPADLAMIQEPPLACPAVRVYRVGNPYQADHWIERQLDHVPDTGFQYVIHNNTENDLRALQASVHSMLLTLADRRPE